MTQAAFIVIIVTICTCMQQHWQAWRSLQQQRPADRDTVAATTTTTTTVAFVTLVAHVGCCKVELRRFGGHYSLYFDNEFEMQLLEQKVRQEWPNGRKKERIKFYRLLCVRVGFGVAGSSAARCLKDPSGCCMYVCW